MNRAIEFISRYRSFALAAHRNPEGDAIGSLLAVRHLLQGLGKSALAYSGDPAPAFLSWLPGADRMLFEIKALEGAEAVIVLDCGDLERPGEEFRQFAASRPTLNIDHHQTNTHFGTVNWVDAAASSTGEMIALLARTMKVRLSPEIATCLYCAILTDTGSFQFPNTTARALELASEMIAAGAKPQVIANHYYHAQPVSRLLLLSRCLATLEFSHDFSQGELVITLEMFERSGAGPDAAEGIINFLMDVATVKVAVLYRQSGSQEWKVSLRSKGELDVAGLCEGFGGGGHKNAAGCRLSGSLAEVKKTVRENVAKLLHSAS